MAGCNGAEDSGGSDTLDCKTSALERGDGDVPDTGVSGTVEDDTVRLVVPLFRRGRPGERRRCARGVRRGGRTGVHDSSVAGRRRRDGEQDRRRRGTAPVRAVARPPAVPRSIPGHRGNPGRRPSRFRHRRVQLLSGRGRLTGRPTYRRALTGTDAFVRPRRLVRHPRPAIPTPSPMNGCVGINSTSLYEHAWLSSIRTSAGERGRSPVRSAVEPVASACPDTRRSKPSPRPGAHDRTRGSPTTTDGRSVGRRCAPAVNRSSSVSPADTAQGYSNHYESPRPTSG